MPTNSTDEALKALRDEAADRKAAIEAQIAPLHAEADAIRAKIAPLEAELRAVTKKIREQEVALDLAGVSSEVARISRSISTTRSLGNAR